MANTGTNPAIETMKTLKFGVEIETVGISRKALATAIAKAIGGSVAPEGGYYDKWVALAPDGRKWTVMSDGSLSSPNGYSGEVVTPVLGYTDIETLQNVIRELKKAGASVNDSCGIHVHVGAEKFDAAALARLAKLTYQQEPLLVAALQVTSRRLTTYTKPVEQRFIDAIEARKVDSIDAIGRAWYGATDFSYAARDHYNGSRYRGLNLHSYFYRRQSPTVEFRYFEATLHAGKIRAYVQLCLALAAKALMAKAAVARKRTFNAATAKYDVRVFLLRLGMIGDEFKTARAHLLDHMKGSAAWKNGRPATVAEAKPATVAAPLPAGTPTLGPDGAVLAPETLPEAITAAITAPGGE